MSHAVAEDTLTKLGGRMFVLDSDCSQPMMDGDTLTLGFGPRVIKVKAVGDQYEITDATLNTRSQWMKTGKLLNVRQVVTTTEEQLREKVWEIVGKRGGKK
ncbi:hypothetical protein DLP05_041 [Stenotrophomonas phage vB_SmaS_DLP_5]|uniref:Uncharacterized protein n=1 Tax=Stenotrophomonas phage vB_SmaS_DLP_5 TaxID=2044561 RepID=A0A2D2W2K4_9CAUD|nr:hypothetical protein FDJ07_gp040 [Stenotrophomonas phage vB_SmaS_DLP_5]ATS92374.1 hypothetical protein DLP05_041 [Stenotrophomonas phage vB_SmaS_DLP_5]